jgi:hypothetical protein
MKVPGANRATQRAADTGSIPLSGARHVEICDDCDATISDGIVTSDGSYLCFACADFWEEVDEAVGA